MCNNCQNNCNCFSLLDFLFGNSCGCNRSRNSNGCGCGCNNSRSSNGCGCGCRNSRNNNGCGCGCGCGCGNSRSTNGCGCGNNNNCGCFDEYYATQYGLNRDACGQSDWFAIQTQTSHHNDCGCGCNR